MRDLFSTGYFFEVKIITVPFLYRIVILFLTIGCSLRLFGSSKCGLGLKTSDINIYLDEENEVEWLRLNTAYKSTHQIIHSRLTSPAVNLSTLFN